MRFLYVFILAIIFNLPVSGQSGISILYGPYLQGVDETEVTVVWVTNKDAVSWVEVAPDDGTHFYAEERPQFFHTNMGRKEIGTLHKVRIYGLEKATTYRYRIYSKEVTAKEPYFIGYGKVSASNVYNRAPYKFKTLDRSKNSTNFIMVNDIHENNELLASLMKTEDLNKPDFVLFNGDMVSNMHNEKQVLDGFLDSAVKLFASELPFFYARGNHESRGLFSTEFIRYFPTTTGQPYYSFRQGPVFFIFLDGGEDKPDSDIEYHGLAAFDQYRESQIEWLKNTLNSEEFRQAPVKIAVMHVPPIRSTWHGPIQVKKHFIPLLNNAGINLMLSGHLHQHHFIPAGDDGCEFPILINSNNHIVNITVEGKSIKIKIKDDSGKLFKEISL